MAAPGELLPHTALRCTVGLLLFVLAGCGPEPTPPDAAPDAGRDAGPPPIDARTPTPTPTPPRPRPIDAGCPPPPDPGAAWVLDLPLSSLEVGDIVRADDGGAWVLATSESPARVWWVRFDPDGEPRVARRAALDLREPPRAAALPGGGVVFASSLGDALLVVAVDGAGDVRWARTHTPMDGRFRGRAVVAADEEGVALAGSLSLETTVTEAVEFTWLSPEGEVSHQRRLTGARDFLAVDAMTLSAEAAVLSMRTNGFSVRTHAVGETDAPVVTPWVMAIDRDAQTLWDTSFDVPVGTHLYLDTIERGSAGWSLGGATEASMGRPFLVELSSDGVVRNVTELPQIPGLAVEDLARDDDGLRLMQSTDDLLYLGPANAEPETLLQLDMRRGRARLAPGRGLYAGPPPPCNARIASSSHPALCGDTRRTLMLLPLPGDTVSPCMRTLFVEPLDDQARNRPLSLPLATGPALQPSVTLQQALPVEADDVPFTPQRLCISRPGCIRTFAP